MKRIRQRQQPSAARHGPSSSTALLCLCTLLLSTTYTSALRILLTNDDGLDQPGLQSLRRALIDDGHDVYVFAPAEDRSGLGASVALSVPFIPLAEQQTIIRAPPASCVIAGLSLMNMTSTGTDQTTDGATEETVVGPPDMVIIGISDGFATGAQTLHSSSVGAAMASLGRGIPTLTVAGLTNIAQGDEETYYGQVASFTVRFLNQWLETIPLEDMPPGVGLKLTYPAVLDPAQVEGVALAATGAEAPLSFGYEPAPLSSVFWQVSPVLRDEDLPRIDPDSESALVDGGFISVLPITSRFYLPEREFRVRFILQLRRMLRNVEP